MTANDDQADLKAFANEIDYFNTLVNDEKAKLTDLISQRINNEKNPYAHLAVVTDTLTSALAGLTARIKVVEKVVLANSNDELLITAPSLIIGDPQCVHSLKNEVCIPAEIFANHNNMYGLEHTESGLAYAWSGPDPEITFDLPIKRDVDTTCRIRFISASDEEMLKDIKISIDGNQIPYNLEFDGECRVIECQLQSCAKTQSSRISLELPRTISPVEQGKGNDERRLGLAIVGIDVASKILEPLRESVYLTAANFSEKENFYEVERSEKGTEYRWTGPEKENNIVVAVSRDKPQNLVLRFVNVIDQALLNGLVIKSDEEVVTHKIDFDGELECILCELPPQTKQKSATKLCLSLPNTISPIERGIGGDARKLGIALVDLKIGPL